MTLRIPSSDFYENPKNIKRELLYQGDIIHLKDDLKTNFLSNFNLGFDPEYLMIVSQTCDLVRRSNRPPKIRHVNVALVRPFKNFLKYAVQELNVTEIENTKVINDSSLNVLKTKLFDLINNCNSKSHFFLPRKSPFKEHMIVVFNTTYPLRFEEQYELLLKNRVLSLKNEYKAKIGDVYATLFDRITVNELIDKKDWSKDKLKILIDNLLDSNHITNANTPLLNAYQKTPISKPTFKKLKREFTKIRESEEIKKSKNDAKQVIKSIKEDLINFVIECIGNQALNGMNDENLKKEITKLFISKFYR